MAESCFSSNESKSFIQISNDNRVSLWDTDTRKEKRTYVEKQHLSHSYTCSSWISGKKDNLGYFAVGTSDGTIVIWDLTRGVISKVLGRANESPVPTSIAFSNDSKFLLVSSSENHIVQYDLSTGKEVRSFKVGKRGVLRIVINPKVEVIAAGGSSVRIIEIESGRKKKLESEFSGGIVALSFTQCGRYLAVAGSGSKEVLLFDATMGAATTPLVAVPVLGEPKTLAVRSVVSGDGEKIEILCVFEDADGCFIRYSIDETDESVRTNVCKITMYDVMASCFGTPGGGKSKNEITLSHGSKTAPTFTTLIIEDTDGNLLENVLIESLRPSSSDLSEILSHIAQSSSAPILLGPHETGGMKRPLVSDEEDSLQTNKHAKLNGNSPALTLEQRLEFLSASLFELEAGSKVSTTSSSKKVKGVKEGKALVANDGSLHSMVVLIDQALQSGNDALLEQVLASDDASIVNATARRLTPSSIVKLLRKLVAKFEKRPSRGLLLTRWLSAVMRSHTSFLIGVPDLSYQLEGLSQMLEQRLSTYARLAALGGRLDLLMAQIASQPAISQVSNGHSLDQTKNGKIGAIPSQTYRED